MSQLDLSPTRRTILTTGLLAGVAALTGCATTPSRQAPGAAAPTPTQATAGSRGPVVGRSGILVAYFSRAGENYWFGGRRTLAVGNTRRLVDQITDRIDCDTYEILAADPYPTAYAPTVDRNVEEIQADARPAIANPVPEVTRYQTVLIGSPVWASQAPLIMSTFVESVDLGGATVLPFVTYAVSGMAGVDTDYQTRLPQATVGAGLAVQGEQVDTSGPDVEAWLRDHNLVTG